MYVVWCLVDIRFSFLEWRKALPRWKFDIVILCFPWWAGHCRGQTGGTFFGLDGKEKNDNTNGFPSRWRADIPDLEGCTSWHDILIDVCLCQPPRILARNLIQIILEGVASNSGIERAAEHRTCRLEPDIPETYEYEPSSGHHTRTSLWIFAVIQNFRFLF